ncbi:hypothetical protein [Polyangium sp. 6x1]|uniref:hypothetical protein n=1 Tax=Polyangium sp. 6x1 TaxID=3042689 RepID=UPI0024832888|nr:hypothetical protein [Polyangium sp. 6x1]MDI1449514.1 hypothetical protein [Polyangium sp. 6x1]
MALLTYSVIRRHMKRSPAFHSTEDVADLPLPITLTPGEHLVGWYQNPPPWTDVIVIFTSTAIYTSDAGTVFRIGLDEITDYETPKDKTDATGVYIRTQDGFRFVRMAGSYGPHGKFKDVFNLIMILGVIVRSLA